MTPLDEEVARAMGCKPSEGRETDLKGNLLWTNFPGLADYAVTTFNPSTSWEDFGAALLFAQKQGLVEMFWAGEDECDFVVADYYGTAPDPRVALCLAISEWAKIQGGDAGLRGKDGR